MVARWMNTSARSAAALELVRVRPQAEPNAAFLKQLDALHAELEASRKRDAARPGAAPARPRGGAGAARAVAAGPARPAAGAAQRRDPSPRRRRESARPAPRLDRLPRHRRRGAPRPRPPARRRRGRNERRSRLRGPVPTTTAARRVCGRVGTRRGGGADVGPRSAPRSRTAPRRRSGPPHVTLL